MSLVDTIKRSLRVSRSKYNWKYDLVGSYGRKYGCRILVETGTFLGDMVYSQMDNFEKIYTVELSAELYSKADYELVWHGITCFHGDSGEVLPKIMSLVDAPALFWLDAHYSGWITAKSSPPVMKELAAILTHHLSGNHVIMIDDISMYNGDLDNIKSLINSRNSINFILKDIFISTPIKIEDVGQKDNTV